MRGADYIAEFLEQKGIEHVFLLTGGAATFMIDAVARRPALRYVCVQHEQAASMAADAVWRVNGRLGATMATSGPGATNLITGIACSYFDSIPSMHFTGQVNKNETSAYLGARPRQVGFQETMIVEMTRPITKYAVQVLRAEDLPAELEKAYNIAISGRMGPVLIDVPMDVQQAEVGPIKLSETTIVDTENGNVIGHAAATLKDLLQQASRPLVYLGAGIGLAGAEASNAVEAWLQRTQLPFVSSWNASTYFNHDVPNYCGTVGVYGGNGAHTLVSQCDVMIVLGSRLDNRQRTGNPSSFAPQAKVHVFDIDAEELAKFKKDGYGTTAVDFRLMPKILEGFGNYRPSDSWSAWAAAMREKYLGKNHSSFAEKHGTLSPYDVIRKINTFIAEDAIVVNDTGAALCWFYQVFHRKRQTVFTAGGMSPMGYSLPAAIGAKLAAPDKQVICFAGDGGLQLNIQELQTLVHLKLAVTIVVLNNNGYGIIKQFQDTNMHGRYEASGTEHGYSAPDFGKIAAAYGIPYCRVEKVEDISAACFRNDGAMIVDVILDPNTQVEPKLGNGRTFADSIEVPLRVKVAATG